MNWLTYANQGATRNQPLSNDLLEALSFMPELGLEMKVFSGGQPAKGSGKPRVGSTRHDHGNAADVFLYKDGQRLDWSNPEQQPIFQEFVQRARANGVTGIGAGDNYMQPGSMHVGFGNDSVWGAGGKGANAAPWLREAANGSAVTRAIADDAMAAIGRQPTQRGTQTAIGGSGADTMNTPQQGLLGQIARPDEKVGGLLGMMFGNMTPDRADQIRASLGGLQGINNQGMVDGARGRMRARSGARENDLNYARQQQQTEQERQREAQRMAQAQEWIAQNAPPEIASAVQSGVLTPQQAYAIANKPPEGAPAAVQALEQRALLGGLKPGTPEYQQFMIDGGAKSGLALNVGTDGSVSFSTGSASAKPLTEGQSKDTVYATRAEGALTILDQYDSNLAGLGNRMLDADPTGLVRGKLQDTDYQLARQAGDEFLQAILRKDTGAAITEPEQELYGTTYLPQPGDGPEVIAQKKQSRKRAIEAIKAGMPPSAIVAKEMALLRSGDKKPEAADGATDADGWQTIDGVRIRVKP